MAAKAIRNMGCRDSGRSLFFIIQALQRSSLMQHIRGRSFSVHSSIVLRSGTETTNERSVSRVKRFAHSYGSHKVIPHTFKPDPPSEDDLRRNLLSGKVSKVLTSQRETAIICLRSIAKLRYLKICYRKKTNVGTFVKPDRR